MSRFVQLFTKPDAKKKVERIAKLDRRTISETVNVIADEALARRLEPTTATRLPVKTEKRPVPT
jgi:hypothetical protein